MALHKYIKAMWVKALRSGDYTQGTQQLRDESDNFCCLGVLCNIHAQMHPKLAAAQLEQTQYFRHIDNLPAEVMKWAGLTNEDPIVTIDHKKTYLSNHNDGSSVHPARSFAEIADAIEAQL